MNFKLAFKVQEVIKSQYRFSHLSFNDNRIHKYETIFTTKEELSRLSAAVSNISLKNIIFLNPNDSPLQLKMNIIKALTQIGSDECVFGIDPGLSIGLSAIYRNEVVETNLVYSKENAIDWIRKIKKYLSCSDLRIRLGKGGGSYMHELLDLLEKHFPYTQIELIDERSTSLKLKKDLSIHEQAAIQIARRFN